MPYISTKDLFVMSCVTSFLCSLVFILWIILTYKKRELVLSIYYALVVMYMRVEQINESKKMGGVYMFSIEFEMAVILFLFIILILFVCDVYSSCKYRMRMLQAFKEKENWFLKESAANKATVKSAQENLCCSVSVPDDLKEKSIHNEQK